MDTPVTARPFDSFEIATVIELPDTDGTTFYERVRTVDELANEEAIAVVYTVYGWRAFPDPEAADFTAEGYGHTAISDFTEAQPARNFATAIAAGRPIADHIVE